MDPRPWRPYDPVVEADKKDVDLTLIRENLKLTVTERFQTAMAHARLADELRRAGREGRERDRVTAFRNRVSLPQPATAYPRETGGRTSQRLANAGRTRSD